MLEKSQLQKLRQEIVLNSLFIKDYKNSLGIPSKAACDFFDSYCEYLKEIAYQETKNVLIDFDFIDEYDNIENLYAYYLTFENDPLETYDDIISYYFVTEYVKDNKNIDIYCDYRDTENIEYLLKNFKSKDDFIDNIQDAYNDALAYEITSYIDDFIYHLKIVNKNDNEFIEYIDNNDIYSIINELIYDYVDINYPIDNFMNTYIKINIFYDRCNPSGYSDKWLVNLLHKQRYRMKDHLYLKKACDNRYSHLSYKLTKKENAQLEKDKNNKFLMSVLNEIENAWLDSPRDLCFIASVTVHDYFMLLEKDKSFVINKDVICGLVDRYNGGGSVLDIQLEKDIVLNTSDISIMIEGVDRYTVNDIYGLCSSAFKEVITINEKR